MHDLAAFRYFCIADVLSYFESGYLLYNVLVV